MPRQRGQDLSLGQGQGGGGHHLPGVLAENRRGGAFPPHCLHLGEVDELSGGVVLENAEIFRRRWLT